MASSGLHEMTIRGTPDFPIEYTKISHEHYQYNILAHWHRDFEMIRILKGEMDMTLNNKTVRLKQGAQLFIPGGVIHSATPYNAEYECISVNPLVLYCVKKCKNLIYTNICKPVILNNSEAFNSLFDEYASQSICEFSIISLIYKVVSETFNAAWTVPVSVESKIDKVKAAITYIEENYSGNITLSELSEKCMMSSNYFCKFFKDLIGKSPVEYINAYRIEIACDMLLSGSSVTDTAYECGFNDLSYFIHVFKKHIGISPKKYILNN
ncbi:MAG: AraC family transcriptional regulator [Clostridia bacterium]|nr:AraC family transcriptional regulator [Clostridia bacterium]